jgi:surfactin synthase thioesterase subunit
MSRPPMPLLCLPYAGAGASVFWPWTKSAVPGLSVLPVQLPGREERLDEEPHRDAHQATDALLPEVLALIGGSSRVALFGHSLGAVLAYELTRRLVERTGVGVAHLFVSGSPGPWRSRVGRASGLGDDEFLAQVETFAGYRHPVFDDPDMRELLLPTLRADVTAHEDYRPTTDAPLDVPITAVRGVDDRLVSTAQAAQWRAATGAGFSLIEVAGGHMHLVEHPQALLDIIGTVLRAVAAEPR